MIALIWYAGILTRLAVSLRIWSSEKLRHRHGYLALWLLMWAAADIIRRMISYDRWTWEYAQLWALSDWPVLGLQALMTAEQIGNLIRDFGDYNKTALRGITGVLALVSVFICTASACLLECRLIRWDRPLLVQVTISVDRVLTLACALLLLTGAILLQSLKLRRFTCLNLRVNLFVLPAFLLPSSVLGYSTLLLGMQPQTLYWLQIGFDGVACALACVLLITLRSSRQWDFTPPDFEPGYTETRRWAVKMIMRRMFDALRKAWRRLRRAPEPIFF